MTCCELAQTLGSVSMQNGHSAVLHNLPKPKDASSGCGHIGNAKVKDVIKFLNLI